MGFGIKVDVPKVEVPKVEVPKVDVAAVVSGATSAVDSAKAAVTGAVDSAKDAVSDAVGAVTGAVSGAVDAAKALLSTVAGAIADVAVNFTGSIEDFVLEPHFSLDANASFGKTKFEKGPIWIRVECTPEEAKANTDMMHVFSATEAYDKKLKVCDFTKDNGRTVDLLFEEAPMGEKYSLEVIKANGGKKIIFSNVAYGDLRRTKQRFV